jgi:hypothetical protein
VSWLFRSPRFLGIIAAVTALADARLALVFENLMNVVLCGVFSAALTVVALALLLAPNRMQPLLSDRNTGVFLVAALSATLFGVVVTWPIFWAIES